METGGNCNARGASGERGCFQFMESTWEYWSKHIFGYVEDITPVNEYYVAVRKIQYHLDQGYSDRQVILIWNQGNPSPCKAGVNRQGASYDSCAYSRKVLAQLQ